MKVSFGPHVCVRPGSPSVQHYSGLQSLFRDALMCWTHRHHCELSIIKNSDNASRDVGPSITCIVLQVMCGICAIARSIESYVWKAWEQRMQERDTEQSRREKLHNHVEEHMLQTQRTVFEDWQVELCGNQLLQQRARGCIQSIEDILLDDGCLSEQVGCKPATSISAFNQQGIYSTPTSLWHFPACGHMELNGSCNVDL